MNLLKTILLCCAFFCTALLFHGCDKDEPLDEVLLPPLPPVENTDKPETEKPNPDKPDPENPDPEQPDPEKPGPEEPNPNPEKPDPDKPDPEKPGPEQPDPDPNPEPLPQPQPEPEPEPTPPLQGEGSVLWMHGLSGMPKPDSWKGVVWTPYLKGLKWEASYGWYDCNKKDPMGEQAVSDNKMCWAAAVSNVIYWWLEQNRSDVNRYGYNGPSKYNHSKDAEVFNFFKKNFMNDGNNVAAAFNWFFTGRSLTGRESKGGFFQKLLGDQPVCETTQSLHNRFSSLIKEALTQQKGIVCVHSFGITTHAINIWGAEFNAQGEVTHIYITDNNDSDLSDRNETASQTPVGMIRKPIEIRNGIPYMEGSVQGNYSIRIMELDFLSLKRTEWNRYFQL